MRSKIYMAWRKNFSEKFTYRGGTFGAPMPRRCRHRSCPDWLKSTSLFENFNPKKMLLIKENEISYLILYNETVFGTLFVAY